MSHSNVPGAPPVTVGPSPFLSEVASVTHQVHRILPPDVVSAPGDNAFTKGTAAC